MINLNLLLLKKLSTSSESASQSSAQDYLTTAAMLLSSQNCNYLSGSGHRNGDSKMSLHSPSPSPEPIAGRKVNSGTDDSNTITGTNSLFTIDSILAPPKCNSLTSSSSPTAALHHRNNIPTLLHHHPGLHLSHLAAAASGFGSTPDFLGKNQLNILQGRRETKNRSAHCEG